MSKMKSNQQIKISVITTTFNVQETIIFLINSLKNQSYKNFKWIVQDGGSTDSTLSIIKKEVNTLNCCLISEFDKSLFDGLNKALKRCDTEYYLFLGADDILHTDTIERLMKIISNCDESVIVSPYECNGIVANVSKLPFCMVGPRCKITGYAVGSLVKTNLHLKYGYFDTSYKIAADFKFFMKCIKGGEKFYVSDKSNGIFGADGLSSRERIRSQFELTLALIEIGSNYYLQSLLLLLRMVRIRHLR